MIILSRFAGQLWVDGELIKRFLLVNILLKNLPGAMLYANMLLLTPGAN
jgi:hypothetical protein